MIVGVDATALGRLINPKGTPPDDPETGRPVNRAEDRIRKLISDLERDRSTIVIPTPALAEALVVAGDAGPAIIERLRASGIFSVAPFDERAAVELAAMTRDALRAGHKSSGSDAPWQKVKLDRQILAIARTRSAQRFYTDDRSLIGFARAVGMEVVQTWELPLPTAEEPDLFSIQLDSSREG